MKINKKIYLIGICILLIAGITIAQLTAEKPSDITDESLKKEFTEPVREYVDVTIEFMFNNEILNYNKTIDCNVYADSAEQLKEVNRIIQIAINEDKNKLIGKGDVAIKLLETTNADMDSKEGYYYDFENEVLKEYNIIEP